MQTTIIEMKKAAAGRMAPAASSNFGAMVRKGVALAALWVLVSPGAGAASAANVTVLHSFRPVVRDGASPYGSVTVGQDGAIYGVTWGGGAGAGGTIFRLNPGGDYTVLRSFGYSPDGKPSFAGLAQGKDGALYGVAYFGGAIGDGTIFRIGTNGTDYHVLHDFAGTNGGKYPYGNLIQGYDGSLYGTTEFGGPDDAGVVFKVDPDGGNFTVLHNFSNVPDGATPYSGLVQGPDGALYGTTSAGGKYVIGTVFTINTNGNGYAILHHFGGMPDGASPQASLVLGPNGALYGTTVIGGTNGFGTVFKLNIDGSGYSVLRHFADSPDGANPYGGLVQGPDGALYGTATWGGSSNAGAIFRLGTSGADYAVIYSFTSTNGDGALPNASMVAGTDGMLYGTTLQGGTDGFGTVFQLAVMPVLPTVGITSSSGGAQLTVAGKPDQSCRLQATTDLVQWTTLTTLVLTNGMGVYTDPEAAFMSYRFYRVVVP